MQVFNRPSQSEDSSRDRIKKAAIKLFADGAGSVSPGYEGNGGGVGGDFLKWCVGEKLNKIIKTKIWGADPPNPPLGDELPPPNPLQNVCQ